MSERQFNTPTSRTEIHKEWRDLPSDLYALLYPFRNDSQGYAAVRYEFRGKALFVDIQLVRSASKDDLLEAVKFVAAEINAHRELTLYDADLKCA